MNGVKISELPARYNGTFRTCLTGRHGLVLPQDDPGSAPPRSGAVRVGLDPLPASPGRQLAEVGNLRAPEEKWLHPDVVVLPGWDDE